MRRYPLIVAALALPLSLSGAGLAQAAGAEAPPPKFGTDYDDPQTPNPSPRPAGVEPTCSIPLMHHEFDDFSVPVEQVTVPASCGAEWSSAVLTLDGSVAGVQFDRIGWVKIDGTTVLRLSTPEPSKDGISWHVEQDVTQYQDVFTPGEPIEVSAFIGNVVNETYTGVLDVDLTLDLYAGKAGAQVPHEVVALDGEHEDAGDTVGTVTMPRNSTKVVAEVYATGSGGGCEEFWDTSAPPETGYWCGDGMPYREVQISVDGQLAGTALPYAVVYTGGWSNPYMWMPNPSPWAYDIPALSYDLTPFAALLNDGQAHEVRFHVVGFPEGGGGWALLPNVFAWTDESVDVIDGALVQAGTDALVRDETFSGSAGEAGATWHDNTQHVTTSGYLDLPSGRTWTTVERSLRHVNDRAWTAGEMRDDIDETSTDTQVVDVRKAHGPTDRTTTTVEWTKAGYTELTEVPGNPDALQIYTDLAISHATTTEQAKVNPKGKVNVSQASTQTYAYDGWGDWTAGIPRDQRVATSESTATFTITDKHDRVRWSNALHAINGYYVS